MKKLEYLAYLCLIALSLISGSILIHRAWTEHSANNKTQMRAEDLVGKHLEVPKASWDKATANLVFFISTQCHFCEESTPFYQQVSSTGAKSVVFLSPEPPEKIKIYLLKHAILASAVYQIKVPDPILRGTPTALVVDRNGVIRHAEIGYLNSQRQTALLNAMSM